MSYKSRSTLTTKGQITLPVELRRRWDLKPGDCIDFCLEDDGRVVLRKWLRRSILEAREALPPLSRPAADTPENGGNPGRETRKPRP
jgi:antitoxin PrlF